MVCGHGVNDMQRGWRTENNWNKKVYEKWKGMLTRCYSEKYHEKQPTYIGCYVCDNWLLLSNFIRDFKLIDGYDEEKFLNGELELDKDIKTNGVNKEYSLENCMLVSKSENSIQSNKTMDYSFLFFLTGENNPMYGRKGENASMYGRTGKNNPCSIKIQQYDKQTHELIKVWDSIMDIKRKLGINESHIVACCKFWKIGCSKEEWFKTHKEYPRKSCGGYIFKYAEEDDKID